MKNITKDQILKIHALLAVNGWMENKTQLIYMYSNERTTHTKELFFDEAESLIHFLHGADKLEVKRRKIIAQFYSLGWLHEIDKSETDEQLTKALNKTNLGYINYWLLDKGTVKKKLNDMNSSDLTRTIKQLEIIQGKEAASKAVRNMLEELNISVLK